jgi:uncharacterized coiled-coil DUF342 family protein|tara:strand:+ start:1450 stop:1692 length:243 start_codon:yes stop_codon:yes gene_type:complete
MTDVTDAEKVGMLRERVASLELELEQQYDERDELKQRRDGLLEQVGRLEEERDALHKRVRRLQVKYSAMKAERDAPREEE